MCGRYVLYGKGQVEQLEMYGHSVPPTYNAAPTQSLPFIIQNDEGERELRIGRWGLLPIWARDTKVKPFFNARSDKLIGDELAKNKVFGKSVDSRCLVPMSGFYEWPPKDRTAPRLFTTPDQDMFYVAGLWRRWRSDDLELDTFTAITTPPHPEVKKIHHRSPAILTNEETQIWLGDDRDQALSVVQSPYSGELQSWKVDSKVVNNARNNTSDCIRPAMQ